MASVEIRPFSTSSDSMAFVRMDAKLSGSGWWCSPLTFFLLRQSSGSR
jgi:hypothetical protein